MLQDLNNNIVGFNSAQSSDSTAWNWWKQGIIKGRQLPTGTIKNLIYLNPTVEKGVKFVRLWLAAKIGESLLFKNLYLPLLLQLEFPENGCVG
ncbi:MULTISPECIES: hypothetical protein [unclassified Microcoleus]|uniref:hypothetical protein n=1 Tax=unclassified Microcoleus TaxID=2642155 RepID=UPI002FD3F8EB